MEKREQYTVKAWKWVLEDTQTPERVLMLGSATSRQRERHGGGQVRAPGPYPAVQSIWAGSTSEGGPGSF